MRALTNQIADIFSPNDNANECLSYINDRVSLWFHRNFFHISMSVNFLPVTVEGLRKRFHELYTEFTRQGKHEHKNKLVFLSDELLRQQGIYREE